MAHKMFQAHSVFFNPALALAFPLLFPHIEQWHFTPSFWVLVVQGSLLFLTSLRGHTRRLTILFSFLCVCILKTTDLY